VTPLSHLAIPFPVEPIHEVRPDLKKIELDSFSPQTSVLDSQADFYLAEKLRHLNNTALNASIIAADAPAPEPPLLDAMTAQMQCQLGFVAAARTQRNQELQQKLDLFVASQPAAWRPWHRLALTVQDDLVLMQLRDQQFLPAWLHVCFPSGWDPASKAGADFNQVHGPVADNSRLLAGAKGIANAMISKGPFVRYVWTLSYSSQLSQHPWLRAHEPAQMNPIYYRCERQVTLPLPQWACSLFLIRVFVAPLEQVAYDAQRCQLMVQSLRSMSQATLQYKNLVQLAPVAIAQLESKAHELSR
jgi:hypothetical protein